MQHCWWLQKTAVCFWARRETCSAKSKRQTKNWTCSCQCVDMCSSRLTYLTSGWWRKSEIESLLIPLASVCLNVCLCPGLWRVSMALQLCVWLCVLLHRCCYCCCCCCYCYYCCYCCFSCPPLAPHHSPVLLFPLLIQNAKERNLTLCSQKLKFRDSASSCLQGDAYSVSEKPEWVSEKKVPTLLPLTARTCFIPTFLFLCFSFFTFFLALFSLRSHSL